MLRLSLCLCVPFGPLCVRLLFPHHLYWPPCPALPLGFLTTPASAKAGPSSATFLGQDTRLACSRWDGRGVPWGTPWPLAAKGLVPSGSLGVSTEDLSLTRGFYVCLPVASLCQARMYFGAPWFW